MNNYILIMRHGKSENGGQKDSQLSSLTRTGKNETKEVAKKLLNILTEIKGENNSNTVACNIVHANTAESIQTGKIIFNYLEKDFKCKIDPDDMLSPRKLTPYKYSDVKESIANKFLYKFDAQINSKAVIIVGHQPLLGLIIRKLTGKSISITHSEAICLSCKTVKRKIPSKFRILWIISPTNEEDIVDVKKKIESKLKVAQLFSILNIAILGLLLVYFIEVGRFSYLGKHIWAFYLSSASFFISIILYLATIYAYHHLLLPSRFWSSKLPLKKPEKLLKWRVWRPPSSKIWILYQNMMRIWRYFFTFATLFLVGGLLLLGYTVFKIDGLLSNGIFFGVLFFGTLSFFLYYRKYGPILG